MARIQSVHSFFFHADNSKKKSLGTKLASDNIQWLLNGVHEVLSIFSLFFLKK